MIHSPTYCEQRSKLESRMLRATVLMASVDPQDGHLIDKLSVERLLLVTSCDFSACMIFFYFLLHRIL